MLVTEAFVRIKKDAKEFLCGKNILYVHVLITVLQYCLTFIIIVILSISLNKLLNDLFRKLICYYGEIINTDKMSSYQG